MEKLIAGVRLEIVDDHDRCKGREIMLRILFVSSGIQDD
jgi:hypothetical protein